MLDKVRIALAEMGYGDVPFDGPGTQLPHPRSRDPHFLAAWWVAVDLVGFPCACWACWEESHFLPRGDAADCLAGVCQHPEGPARPPRELLVAAR